MTDILEINLINEVLEIDESQSILEINNQISVLEVTEERNILEANSVLEVLEIIEGLNVTNITSIEDGVKNEITVSDNAETWTINKTFITNKTLTTTTADDIVLFSDNSDTDNLKKATVQSILDLATGGTWGSITGTLSDQIDLQSALNLKADITSLGLVATSNSYNDLDNLPSLFNGDYNSLSNLPDLSTYLESGDNISLLTNDAGYITSSSIPDLTPYAKLDGSNQPFTANIGISAIGLKVNSNASFFGPSSLSRFLDIYSGTEANINLRSGLNTNGGILGGLYYTRELGQGDAHLHIAAIQARQVGTGTLAGGQLRFFTKNNGSGTLSNDSAMTIDYNNYIGIGLASPLDSLHVFGRSRFVNSGNGTVRIGEYTMGAPINSTSSLRMDIGNFSIAGWYPILSQNCYYNGSAWVTTTTGYSLLQYTDPSTGIYTLINTDASYATGTNLSVSSRLKYYFAFKPTGIFETIYSRASNGSAAAPAYSFKLYTNNGMYSSGAGILQLSTAGVSRVRIDATGTTIGADIAPEYSHQLDIRNGGNSILIGGDNYSTARTNNTAKYARVGLPHYTNAQNPVALMVGFSIAGTNAVYIGGGTGAYNAVNHIYFNTASTNTTPTGTTRMTITGAGKVGIGITPTYDLDVVGEINASTAYRVGGTVGYTGDLNDSTSTKIADVVGGIITAVYF